MKRHGLLFLFLGMLEGQATTFSVACNPNIRLKAKISKDSMNRIMVVGDRITQVFGDNEAYEIQTEETTGQIFIKPTSENGDKPLSITLITENTLTQDLLLEPVDAEASTLILKAAKLENIASFTSSPVPHMSADVERYLKVSPQHNTSLSFQEHMIQLIQKMVLEDAPEAEEDTKPKRVHGESRVEYVRSHSLTPYKGQIFRITNIAPHFIDLKEEDWFQEGDMALSFESTNLSPQQSTLLYVVRQ